VEKKDVTIKVPTANMTIHTGNPETKTQKYVVVMLPEELLPEVQELLKKWQG